MLSSEKQKSFLVAATSVVAVGGAALLWYSWRLNKPSTSDNRSGYEKLIGSTPLVRLDHLSALLKRSIYLKMECLNPGGTGKDRAALSMIQQAEKSKLLPPPFHCQSSQSDLHLLTLPEKDNLDSKADSMDTVIEAAGKLSKTGGIVVEGTSGSTGISLAVLAAGLGHGCIVVLPDDQASEKKQILQGLGAQVHIVHTASISNPNHYVNIARRVAERARNVWGYQAVFMDQFENPANFQIHYERTGPEIYRDCPGLDAFVMSSGTGGTIAGVGKYLKEKCSHPIQIVLVDPPGSSLYHKIEHGIAYAPQQAEQRLKRHRYDTLAEGIGLDRITQNFAMGESFIDRAIRVSDQAAVDMAHWLLSSEGLFVGSSSAMNVVGAVETALSLPEGSSVVTVICDTGQRHVTRFWSREFCLKWGLEWPGDKENATPECLLDVLKD